MKKNLFNISLFFLIIFLFGILGFQLFAATAERENNALFLVEKNIIAQSSDYKLDSTISRREMLKVMMNLSGKEISSSCSGEFRDLPSSDWGCKYAESALKNGYISANSYFRPNDSIMDIEALKMIMQASNIPKADTPLSSWQEQYIQGAKNAGLTVWDTYDETRSQKILPQAISREQVFRLAAESYSQNTPESSLPPEEETSIISPVNGIPAVYSKIYGASSITSDGTYVTITSDGIPKSKSVYYTTTHPLYEFFSGKTFGGFTFKKNPNTIVEGEVVTMKIPLNPEIATTHQKTQLGAIGMAVDGVPFFNQYAGPNKPLTDEMQSFDQNDGHPERSGHYHYHVEPLAITESIGTDALMGFLMDGFPVYGTYENGKKIMNTDLDNFHGHSHITGEYPDGIYHYHITDEVPYLNGDGYYGTPGTITQ